ncbi:MAG: carboxypeptidase-like regulatory domain-containing protein [Planctomycetota bacterium]
MNSHGARLVGLLLFLAAGGALAWWLLAGTRDTARGRGAGPSVVEPDGPRAGSVELAGSSTLDAAQGAEPRRDALRASDADAGAARATDVPSAAWSGRVSWPAGTPADERGSVRVLTSLTERAPFWEPNGEDTEPVVVATAEVDAEGHFTVDVPLEGERWIEVMARYSYFDRPLALPQVATGPLVLSPLLGAWVVGRVEVPTSSKSLAGAVQLAPAAGGGTSFRSMLTGAAREHATEFGADAAFELGGVPAGKYRLTCTSDTAAPYSREELSLLAGVRHELVLTLEPGVCLAGVVVDQVGVPVADVEVTARRRERDERRGFDMLRGGNGAAPRTRTDSEGRFRLSGVAPGGVRLQASDGPLLDDATLDLTVEHGVTVDDLELVAERGAALFGRVTWPDERPAAACAVVPTIDAEATGAGDGDPGRAWRSQMRLAAQRTTTERDGSFRIEGLDPDYAYRLTASFDPNDVREERRAAVGGRAELRAVRTDDSPLSLVLEDAPTLTGYVQAPDGTPISDFELSAADAAANRFRMNPGGGAEPVEASISDPEGAFTLSGLTDGTWRLTLRAAGFAAPAEPVEIIWPDALEAAPPVVTLVPEARLLVRVVGPNGKLVPGAEVRDVTTGWRERMRGGGRELAGHTDAFGELEFTGLAAGRYELVASANGFARSAPSELMLAPGDVKRDVRLDLARGGRIEGTLLDVDGDVDGRTILVSGISPGQMDDGMLARTDTKGRFALEAVPAGTWNLIAPPAEVRRGGQPFSAGLESARVEVVEGETAYVELGTPPAEPVAVSGRVTAAGQPVTAEVVFVRSGENFLAGLARAMTDDQGAYSVVLDEPGAYSVSATPSGRRLAHRRTVVIAGETTLDLEIPGGSISGIVRKDGEPQDDVRVRVMVDGPQAAGSLLAQQFENVETNDEGEYRLEGLAEGKYRVSVGGSRFGMGRATARQVVSGIEVRTDRATRGVDFDLGEPGTISALVVDRSGKPVGSGTLFVRDAEGRVVNPIGISERSTAGRYEVDGISPGRYTVGFRSTSLVSAESASIGVTSGETSDLKLVAEEGTKLVVTVVDEEGEPVDARIAVTDAEGKEFHGMTALDFAFGPPSEGWSPGKSSYGPLPPGEYEVHVVDGDDAETRRKVKLSGQAERKLTVRLR